jgi:hypothetical protein
MKSSAIALNSMQAASRERTGVKIILAPSAISARPRVSAAIAASLLNFVFMTKCIQLFRVI